MGWAVVLEVWIVELFSLKFLYRENSFFANSVWGCGKEAQCKITMNNRFFALQIIIECGTMITEESNARELFLTK
jgi:hypothetical protein